MSVSTYSIGKCRYCCLLWTVVKVPPIELVYPGDYQNSSPSEPLGLLHIKGVNHHFIFMIPHVDRSAETGKPIKHCGLKFLF